MLETEAHDLSDDPDYAASQQQQLARTLRCDSGKISDAGKMRDAGETSGAEVVYSKDNVAIHPAQYASKKISGRLRLIMQESSLFMSWIPYKISPNMADSVAPGLNSEIFERDRNLYTISPVPFSEVHSIRRHTPTLGWQYIIVVLSSGLAYPPLYFYNGGAREFLATLKQHVFIVRSVDDTNVFLVNYFMDPLQRSLSSLELPRAVPLAKGASVHNSVGSVSTLDKSEIVHGDHYDGTFSASEYRRRQKPRAHDPARDVSIQVLEKFSLVTKFAREATSHLFGDSHDDGFSVYEKKQHGSYTSASITDNGPKDMQTALDVTSLPLDPSESDELSLVWGKKRQPPLSVEEWTAFLDSEGRILNSKALRKRIFYGGIEHNLRKEVWKFLLGYYEYDSTYAEREYLTSMKKSEYETIKSQWKNISAAQAKRFTKFRERKGLIEKDVVRTDRSFSYYDGDDNPNVEFLHDILMTYSFYNFDLGYCQGMSDLLSPILFVMEDEPETFWCFVALMERLGPNFNRDQNGMHSQLLALSKLVELLDRPLHNYFKQNDCLNYFFCFRWILIQFKREFPYEKIMYLWEVLWTHYLSEHIHLYICVAILKKYRKKIIDEQMDFDTLLKFINELSGQIDLDGIIKDAEALCICAGENGAACIPAGTPPSLPVDMEMGFSLQEDEILISPEKWRKTANARHVRGMSTTTGTTLMPARYRLSRSWLKICSPP